VVGYSSVDDPLAVRGQGDQHAAPVAGIGTALDKPGSLQPVDAVRHRRR
jgi:hypothetical protein